ncbi:helix-turn-helix transcriptional regulator [Serratia fonticola]|uniref:Helix-turn-helix transcriptional regulator n=2 Tax=Serratia fonticola TaxID=47917 RepID=A0AAW3WUY8_SERFO|nr:helix-turn-helix transcriptional regulator [Serratia fonticola]NYA13605.1 helix-turn-helix transcriptional regulator [Serratia fonticola]NYA35066.1 helix-turn-helix transcriptional regulator [Serratia fonticola]
MTNASKVFPTQQKSIEPMRIFKGELTEREKTILYPTINDMRVQSISRILCISVKTVYTHRRNAFPKLGR